MFNEELFKASEKAYIRNGREDILKRRLKLEKEVLKLIIHSSIYIDEDGIAMIQYPEGRGEYDILNKILTSRLQRHFEDEYSLYFVDNKILTSSQFGSRSVITFVWDSVEYNVKNMNNPNAIPIIRSLNRKDNSTE